MYLKKLEILGFKSFADKTTLHFEPGITAVVGPNGCGKSNIFDSIRWVLGEQSVKAMRGSKMEDIIFNGTDLRPPVGFAEVNLVFSNENNVLSIESHEVIVTRRLYRSGESEYFINKALVRLKDVLELFMGTGVGAESYSLVEQGKMDLVLSSRPEDRRLIFDEASGITKYKSQKREALNKLEDTEQNLVRINDIILEVKRQIDSLERQATKARRYKEIFEELKQLELKLANFQVSKLNKELDLLSNRHAQIRELLDLNQNELNSLELLLSEKKNNLTALNTQINQLKDTLVGLENSIKNDSQYIAITKERIKEINVRLDSLGKLKVELSVRLLQDEVNIAQQKSQLDHIQGLFLTLEEQINKKESLLKEIIDTIKMLEKNTVQEKTNVLDLTTELSRLKNLVTEISVGFQNLTVRKKRLELEKEKTSQEKSSVESVYNELSHSLSLAKSKLDGLILEKDKLDNNLASLDNELLDLSNSCQDFENQKLKLESQKEFIEKLKSEYEGLPEHLNAVILVENLPEKLSGILARVNSSEPLDTNLKQNFRNLNHMLHCDAKPIPLETQTIIEKIEEIVKSICLKKEQILEKNKFIADTKEALKNLSSGMQLQEIEVANLNTKLDGVSSQLNKLKEEVEVVGFEIDDLGNEISSLNTKDIQAKTKVKQLEESLANSNKLIGDYQILLQEKMLTREELLVSIAQDKTEFQGLTDKLNSQKQAFEVMEATFKDNKSTLERYGQEEIQGNSRLLEFNKLIEELAGKIDQNTREKENVNSSFSVLNNDLHSLELDFKSQEAKKEELISNVDSFKNDLHKIQIDSKTYEFQKINLIEKILQAYKETVDSQIKELIELDENVLTENINTLKTKLQRYDGASISTIDEFDELKKRYDFLLSQQNDLTSAKESVQEAISKINRTTRKLFVEAFEKIAVEFENYFKYLFGGGQAKVFLLDENNPLDCGIEIVCRPPGKKLQNILLLSGGEKALSATALMFAIFKVKPSPFCVLDEIDAPLDEANVDRFSRVLQDFSSSSQFIVITHNKKTMSNANVMYGITMQEQGVSKIVSVKLSQNKPQEAQSVDSEEAMAGASS